MTEREALLPGALAAKEKERSALTCVKGEPAGRALSYVDPAHLRKG